MRWFVKEKRAWLNGVSSGWGNGYVLLPKDHPWCGKHYDDIPANVHGGLTYSGEIEESFFLTFPEFSDEDIGMWLIGFDTAHAYDSLPTWPKERVEEETKRLFEQAKNAYALPPANT